MPASWVERSDARNPIDCWKRLTHKKRDENEYVAISS